MERERLIMFLALFSMVPQSMIQFRSSVSSKDGSRRSRGPLLLLTCSKRPYALSLFSSFRFHVLKFPEPASFSP
ncbi:hypothetical protein IWZ00DRAFT_499855 [Phyllosticta capitalensis]